MGNEFARQLRIAGADVQCDAQCKKVLSQKVILAWILKYAMAEFQDIPLEKIGAYIEGEAQISDVCVNPGETNTRDAERSGAQRIVGLSDEDKVPGEGAIYYDIRFNVRLPDRGGKLRMLVDLEAQKKYSPGYEIVTRGIFYGSRMISAQLGTGFEVPDYNGICKVASIWICMNAPKKAGNTIASYQITKRDLHGTPPDKRLTYDKMTVIVVALNEQMETDNILLRMLNILLSPRKSFAEKKEELGREFQIELPDDIGEEVNIMCNYSEYVLEVGLRQGRQEGRQQGIRSMISLCKEFGQSRADTMTRICRDFSVTEKTAKKYLNQYWDGTKIPV